MSHKRSQREDKSSDDPPMSRLFVICNKNHTEADLQDEFEKFGTIEEIWCVKNRSNGENKGITITIKNTQFLCIHKSINVLKQSLSLKSETIIYQIYIERNLSGK